MGVKKEGCKKEVVWQKRGGKKTVGVEKKCWQKSRGGRKSNKEWHYHPFFSTTFLPPPPFSCDPLLLAPPIFRHPFNASPILFCKYFHATSFTKSRKPKNLNAPTLAIVAVNTAENEPLKVWAVSFHYFNPILTPEENFLHTAENGLRHVKQQHPNSQSAIRIGLK